MSPADAPVLTSRGGGGGPERSRCLWLKVQSFVRRVSEKAGARASFTIVAIMGTLLLIQLYSTHLSMGMPLLKLAPTESAILPKLHRVM
jgi:hypothetical protein